MRALRSSSAPIRWSSANWVRFDEVIEALERFAIAPRAGVRADALARVIDAVSPALRERITTLNLPEIPESASLVRALLVAGPQRTVSRPRRGLAIYRRASALRI